MTFDELTNIFKSEFKSSSIATERLLDDLINNNLSGRNKQKDFYTSDLETISFKSAPFPIPGNIYTFVNEAVDPNDVTLFGTPYHDLVPLVFVVRVNPQTSEFTGFNLNYMSPKNRYKVLRSLWDKILMMGNVDQYIRNNKPYINEPFISAILSSGVGKFIKTFSQITETDLAACYRQYDMKTYKRFRMVEPYQWAMIPNITYNNITGAALTDIWFNAEF